MFRESQTCYLCVCGCYWHSSKQMEEDANEAWLFGQGFLNPSQKWSLPTVTETTERKKWHTKARDSQFWESYFPLWKYGQRDHVFKKPPSQSSRIKRAVVFLREMLRKDAHSFVPQVFHLLQHKECLWSRLLQEGLGLPDKSWELVSRSSQASLE